MRLVLALIVVLSSILTISATEGNARCAAPTP
jgi:hypothetical protein